MLALTRAGLIAGLMLFLPAWWAVAQTQPEPLTIQLNKVASEGKSCYVDFVVTNRSSTRFDKLGADLVFFDKRGIIAARVTAELGPMRPDKTQVESLPIKSLDCANLGHVLLNQMVECTPLPEGFSDCTKAVAATYRGLIPFVK